MNTPTQRPQVILAGVQFDQIGWDAQSRMAARAAMARRGPLALAYATLATQLDCQRVRG